jgi:hypothetical protein
VIPVRFIPSAFDSGWLFIVAGVAICVSSLLLPATVDLRMAEVQLELLRGQESRTLARLAAYDQFITDLQSSDPAFVERLAASELNLLPKGATPVLHDVAAASSSVLDWIESSVPEANTSNAQLPVSMLGSISQGAHRNLFLGSGVACIFFGLLTSVPGERRARLGASPTHDVG